MRVAISCLADQPVRHCGSGAELHPPLRGKSPELICLSYRPLAPGQGNDPRLPDSESGVMPIYEPGVGLTGFEPAFSSVTLLVVRSHGRYRPLEPLTGFEPAAMYLQGTHPSIQVPKAWGTKLLVTLRSSKTVRLMRTPSENRTLLTTV